MESVSGTVESPRLYSVTVKRCCGRSGPRVPPSRRNDALHWSLSWAISIQPTPSHPISLRSILILSTHLRLGLRSGLFPSGFPTNILYAFLFSPIRATCPAHKSKVNNLITLFLLFVGSWWTDMHLMIYVFSLAYIKKIQFSHACILEYCGPNTYLKVTKKNVFGVPPLWEAY
jgi:hypothetical protein